MYKFKRKIGIKTLRIILPALATVILFIVAIFEFFLPTLESSMIERKRDMIRELTHTAISSMDYFHQEELAGRLTTEEAQKLASAAIRQLRYGVDKKDYFWIQNLDPIFLMHPYRPDLEGTHADEFSDTDGHSLLDSFVRESTKTNGGFVDYYWQWKDDPSRVVPKVSYVKLYEPWEWIVGTGVYIEDVRAEMNTLVWRIVKVSLLILVVIGLMSTLMVWQSLQTDRQRQEAEDSLRASEAQYREIAARIPGVVFQYAMNTDEENEIPFISERTEELIGIQPQEIVADPKLFFQAIHEDERERVVDSLRDAAHRMDNWNREFRLVSRNGDVRWVRASAAPTKIPEKGILWNGLLLDISTLKQSEQEREKLILLVENSTEFVGLIDHTGNFIYINRAGRELLGVEPAEEIGRICLDEVFLPDSNETFPHNGQAALMKNGSWQGEGVLHNRHGEKIDVELGAYLNRDPSMIAPIFTAIIIRDQRARKLAEKKQKRLEEQLQQSQKLEAIGRLAGGIAHDFNNLLTGIIGNLSLAQMDANDEALSYLQTAESAASRASDLVKQLLIFSRKSKPEVKSTDTGELLAEVANMLRATIDRRIEIGTEFNADDDWHILADPSQVHQVLINLCLNAHDAIKAQWKKESISGAGQITMRLGHRHINRDYLRSNPDAKEGRYVVITISDSGSGIDEAVLQHIFEPFFTTKETGKGTGLGLSLVYGIVRQHKGWIEVESQPKKGTSFHVYLPAFQGQAAGQETQTSVKEDMPGGEETILLVDDENIVRNLGKTILTRKGYTILVAENGEEALTLFNEKKDSIDLIILDITMPKMSGLEVLQRIQDMTPGFPVLMSSGYVEQGQIEQLLEMGASGFIGKPYSIVDMTRTVRQTLDRRSRQVEMFN